MRKLVIGLLVLMNFILESTIFQHIRIFGIKPDFTIMIITSYAIIRGSAYGSFIGLASGLLQDIFYGKVIGINSFSYMIVGYMVGQFNENVFKDSYIPSVFLNLGAVFVYQHLFLLITYFTKTDVFYTHAIINLIIPQSIYNAVLAPIVYRLIYNLDERSFMNDKIY